MTSDGFLESMPFAAGFFLIVIQPLFDKAWRGTFGDSVKADQIPVDVVGAADWVANVSAFLPNALLTTFGALYLSVQHDEKHFGLIFWSACTIPVLALALYLFEAYCSKPQESPFIFGLYGKLQVFLVALNALGIFLAFHYN